jgi:glucose/arabinose dehydrogenase
VPDDRIGGPEPDNAHLTGVILRLNDDGTTPRDNPFYKLGKRHGERDGHDDDDGDDDKDHAADLALLSGEARANIQRIFGYGVRNSFGMTFDPKRGDLWTTENGGRAFDEINRVRPGFNGGWVQIMGPVSRVGEFRQLEIAAGVNAANGSPAGLQQARFPATRIPETPDEARQSVFHLPGSRLTDPQFSWKYVVPPAALGFVKGDGLGDKYDGDLIVGSAVARAANAGHLYRFRLNGRRSAFVFDDPRLQDKVADNTAVDDLSESEAIIFGRNFGVVTHIETGADGALYLVSPTNGSIRKITRK